MRITGNARLTLGERVKRAALDIKVIKNKPTMRWYVRLARNAMHFGATALLPVTGILRYGRDGHEHHAHVENTARLAATALLQHSVPQNGLPRYYHSDWHRGGRGDARAKKKLACPTARSNRPKKMGAEAPKVNQVCVPFPTESEHEEQ